TTFQASPQLGVLVGVGVIVGVLVFVAVGSVPVGVEVGRGVGVSVGVSRGWSGPEAPVIAIVASVANPRSALTPTESRRVISSAGRMYPRRVRRAMARLVSTLVLPFSYRLSPIAYRLSPIAYRLSPIAYRHRPPGR